MWCLFATFIVISLGLSMIICEPVEGEDGVFILTADPTVRCGESPQLWLLHIAGACVFFGLALALPVLVIIKVKRFNEAGAEGLERHDRLQKYGVFYEVYDLETWRMYFFPVQHYAEDVMLAIIGGCLSSQPTATPMDIATLVTTGLYVVLLIAVRPFSSAEDMVCAILRSAGLGAVHTCDHLIACSWSCKPSTL
jgi:hypothetical protein